MSYIYKNLPVDIQEIIDNKIIEIIFNYFVILL